MFDFFNSSSGTICQRYVFIVGVFWALYQHGGPRQFFESEGVKLVHSVQLPHVSVLIFTIGGMDVSK